MLTDHELALAQCLRVARETADQDVVHGYAVHEVLDELSYDVADVFHMRRNHFSSHEFFLASGMRDVAGRAA